MKLTRLTTTVLLSCIGCAAAFSALAANISINDVTVTEGGTATLTVSLDAAVERGTVRVDYATQNGTALAGQDYVATSGRVTFRRGEQTQQISVQTVQNSVPEPTETFNVVLSNPSRGDTIVKATGVVTINDDDVAQPSISINDVTVTEGQTANFTISLSAAATQPVTVVASTANGTAVAPGDYTARSNVTVTFPTGTTTQTFAVTTIDDTVVEPQETFTVNLTSPTNATIADSQGVGTINDNDQQQACVPANLGISINSTSQNGCPDGTIPQQAIVNNATSAFSVLAINDLGMHCGDLDTRIASILPPFQVMLAQVIQKQTTTTTPPTLNPAGVSVFYSAAANPADPALALTAFDGLMANGDTYKTNFWDFPLPAGTYDPFYPAFNPFNPAQTLTPLAGPPFNVTYDIGLPVPNVEDLYIGPDGQVNTGDEFLSAVLHAMPGIAGAYTTNDPKLAQERYVDKPFFVNFPFGYVAADVNWYEGAGIPFAAFDDNGRENAYPLVRVQARNAAGTTVATVDTVLPISGEASCTNCHTTLDDYISVYGDGANHRTSGPTDTLSGSGLPVAISADDLDTNLPPRVSLEYAADINVLRLHDLRHGSRYVSTACDAPGQNCLNTAPAPCDITVSGGDGDANCLTNKALVQGTPVVCQVCHYTPALDLAQLGPLAGPEGTIANGRNQVAHQSNSRVMHNHHGSLPNNLFPPIPPPAQDAAGNITNQDARLRALEVGCYQCHPGTNVRCLRGAMFNGGMLCSDCHGDMLQVGADFSAGVSPENPGAFILDQGNFYDPASAQPRVPWANEPGCGSCHTGNFNNNLAGTANVRVNVADVHGNPDNIRLIQAYRNNDAKATPIVPTNKLFAEPAVPASFNGFANPGAGNPQLYRVSTGHGGVMCEGCHGATHAEWPNGNPAANDNVTANQLQGHTGVVIECQTCHGTRWNNGNTLAGPHGMHPVGNDTTVTTGSAAGPRISFVDGGHSNLGGNTANCSGCHGPGGRGSNVGTVLSVAKKDRRLNGQTIPAGTPIGCTTCHD